MDQWSTVTKKFFKSDYDMWLEAQPKAVKTMDSSAIRERFIPLSLNRARLLANIMIYSPLYINWFVAAGFPRGSHLPENSRLVIPLHARDGSQHSKLALQAGIISSDESEEESGAGSRPSQVDYTQPIVTEPKSPVRPVQRQKRRTDDEEESNSDEGASGKSAARKEVDETQTHGVVDKNLFDGQYDDPMNGGAPDSNDENNGMDVDDNQHDQPHDNSDRRSNHSATPPPPINTKSHMKKRRNDGETEDDNGNDGDTEDDEEFRAAADAARKKQEQQEKRKQQQQQREEAMVVDKGGSNTGQRLTRAQIAKAENERLEKERASRKAHLDSLEALDPSDGEQQGENGGEDEDSDEYHPQSKKGKEKAKSKAMKKPYKSNSVVNDSDESGPANENTPVSPTQQARLKLSEIEHEIQILQTSAKIYSAMVSADVEVIEVIELSSGGEDEDEIEYMGMKKASGSGSKSNKVTTSLNPSAFLNPANFISRLISNADVFRALQDETYVENLLLNATQLASGSKNDLRLDEKFDEEVRSARREGIIDVDAIETSFLELQKMQALKEQADVYKGLVCDGAAGKKMLDGLDLPAINTLNLKGNEEDDEAGRGRETGSATE
jgi:hypothetical protein